MTIKAAFSLNFKYAFRYFRAATNDENKKGLPLSKFIFVRRFVKKMYHSPNDSYSGHFERLNFVAHFVERPYQGSQIHSVEEPFLGQYLSLIVISPLFSK